MSELHSKAARGSWVLPMGVASNMLIRDGGVEGLVIRFGGNLARVEVDGDILHRRGWRARSKTSSQTAAKAGLSGLEFMIGIPGTAGGAIRMNAGAFGGETAEAFLYADCLDADGKLHRLKANDLAFQLPPQRLA